MRRLVVTGLPCPPEAWEKFLGKQKGQKILSLFEIFENCDSSDPRQMAKYVAEVIEKYKPDSILCHNLGVPLTIMALLRLSKKHPVETRLTLFNGAFRRMDLLKAKHPFRIQLMTLRRAIREVEGKGGTVDLRLQKYMPRIRALYRYIILYGVSEKIAYSLGLDELIGTPNKFPLKVPIQMIVSPNDPYIPYGSIQQLRDDCSAKRYIEMEYGHFPYSLPREKIIPLIEEFETPTLQAQAKQPSC